MLPTRERLIAAQPPNNRPAGPWPIVIESAIVAVCAYLVAGVSELALIRVFRPSELELTWISDVLLAGALGVAVYLWRHLRTTRLELAARERSQLVLDAQLAIAAEMQRRLLPVLPKEDDILEWAADLRPAGKIGGDFYDIVSLAPGRWIVLVADVSGKGVPAAMALSTVRAVFRSVIVESLEPARVLTQLSARLFEQWGGQPYLTAIVAVVDGGCGAVTYANAGHPAGVVAGAERLQLLTSMGPPAALLPGVTYEEREIAVRPGDIGVFVSDGVTEGLGDAGATMLHAMVRGMAADRSSARATCTRVMELARLGTGPDGVTDWQDDLTAVAFSVRPQAAAAGLAGAEAR